MQTVNTKPQTGGKTKKRKCMNAKGWSEQQPGYHDRTVMMKKCGNKCFLGPKRTFPICRRNTCKINRKGVYAPDEPIIISYLVMTVVDGLINSSFA